MENKKILNKKYLGFVAFIFVAVLVTGNSGPAFSQNNTGENLNLNLTGGDLLAGSNSTGTNATSNWTDSNSTYTPK